VANQDDPGRALGNRRVVRAAGGVVIRRGDGGPEVLLVHRPKYDDWSFPKGKLDDGEDPLDGALREVEEETGLRCDALDSAGVTTYVDQRGRPKRVDYWLMRPREGAFTPTSEVDEVRWVPIREAEGSLTYAHDRALLDRVMASGIDPA
jgi:8-oxo-dGTP pyrophosphatase MutT (NUDIX family)